VYPCVVVLCSYSLPIPALIKHDECNPDLIRSIMESRAHHDRVYSPRGRTDLDLILKKCTLPMNGNASNMALRALPKGRAPHVCIVGAGFAGLRCADVLSQRGLKVTILEGRDRIGGRVSRSIQFVRYR